MLHAWDWELLSNQSKTRLDDWAIACKVKYREIYGTELSDNDVAIRYRDILKNPVFLGSAYLQEWWQQMHWTLKYRLFYLWSQDLNKDGRYWSHGRARLYLLLNNQHRIDTHQGCIKIYWSWTIPGSSFAIEVAAGGEDQGVMLHLGFCLFSLWIALEGILPDEINRRIARYDHERYTGIKIHNGCIWLNVWYDEMGYQERCGWQKVIHFLDFFLGSQRYASRDLEAIKLVLKIDTGEEYDGIITKFESVWTRSRSPIIETVQRFRLEFPIPIPIPGKGDNDYDQEEDSIAEATLCAKDFVEAARKFAESIMDKRVKYGGINWQPKSTRDDTI